MIFLASKSGGNYSNLKENAEKQMQQELIKNNFITSKSIDYLIEHIDTSISFKIDTNSKKIAICQKNLGYKIDFFNYTDIIECEIIEDSNVIMKGGIGRAVTGGILAGGVGAIVGANTRSSKNVIFNLSIRIITNDVMNSLYVFELINTEMPKDSVQYKNAMSFANNVYSTILAIKNQESSL